MQRIKIGNFSFSIYYPKSVFFFHFPPFGFLLFSPWWQKPLILKTVLLCLFSLATAACLVVFTVRLLRHFISAMEKCVPWVRIWIGKLIYFFCILVGGLVVCSGFFYSVGGKWVGSGSACWLQGLGWVLAAAAVEEATLLKEKEKPTEWTIYKILVTIVASHWCI